MSDDQGGAPSHEALERDLHHALARRIQRTAQYNMPVQQAAGMT